MEDYSGSGTRGGLLLRQHPAHHQGGLFHTSGHLPYYADTMFPPMQFEGTDYYLKPMNCPMHILIYQSRGRCYRDLPLRLFEFGTVYRYEKSGVVHGLTRVRGLTMDDSHILLHAGAGAGGDRALLDFVLGLLRDFGLDDFYLELSTRDDASDKFIGGERAVGRGHRGAGGGRGRQRPGSSCPTRAARRSTGRRSPCRRATRSAAPGRCRRSRSTSTSPERFDLEYQAADGTRQRPVMIHRRCSGRSSGSSAS